MASWIFQCQPERFDVDGFLAVASQPFTWLVTRYSAEIGVGDTVYLWKAGDEGGVIAEAVVLEGPSERRGDAESEVFWKDSAAAGTPANRALLRLRRVAGRKQVLRRDWFKDDPVLRSMLIMRQAAGTNFPLNDEEAARLAYMWSRVGIDWTYEESLAGLWAYTKTLGGEISKKPGSPVSEVSVLTGRSVSSVYNKVMNFRAIDPNEVRAGMKGGGATDRQVWSTFFNSERGALDREALQAEFEANWRNAPVQSVPDKESVETAVEREVARLATRSLEELLAAYAAAASRDKTGPGQKSSRERSKAVRTRVFDRDPLVIAIAKKRADYKCEVPECAHPPFADTDGRPYCEVHHIVPLAEGGPDTPGNVACLCPAHHREAHFGRNAVQLRLHLEQVRHEPQLS